MRCPINRREMTSNGTVSPYGGMETFIGDESQGHYLTTELEIYVPMLSRWVYLPTAIWNSYVIVYACNNFIALEVARVESDRHCGLFPASKIQQHLEES